jgi:LEA14-like dessication related protein
MKIKTLLLFAAAIALLSSCTTVQPVTVSGIQNFQADNISLSPEISFDALLHNPNHFGLTIQEFKTSASLNDKLIADIFIEKKIRIGADADIPIPLKCKPAIKDIIASYLSGSFSGTVKLDGYVTAKKFLFRKKFPFSIKTKL